MSTWCCSAQAEIPRYLASWPLHRCLFLPNCGSHLPRPYNRSLTPSSRTICVPLATQPSSSTPFVVWSSWEQSGPSGVHPDKESITGSLDDLSCAILQGRRVQKRSPLYEVFLVLLILVRSIFLGRLIMGCWASLWVRIMPLYEKRNQRRGSAASSRRNSQEFYTIFNLFHMLPFRRTSLPATLLRISKLYL